MEPYPTRYDWYGITSGPDIQQGDIFDACPVYDPVSATFDEDEKPVFNVSRQDVIVLTQSCDLVAGRPKTDHVLVCALWKLTDLPSNHHLSTPKGLEEVRRGNIPGFHMLAVCETKRIRPGHSLGRLSAHLVIAPGICSTAGTKASPAIDAPISRTLVARVCPLFHARRAPIRYSTVSVIVVTNNYNPLSFQPAFPPHFNHLQNLTR